MSKFKVGDKLVALESVKSVRLCIPQYQLDILHSEIATVTEEKENGAFRITFDGCDSGIGAWSFTDECSKHFVKIPQPGDVVTKLVIPDGKSLGGINISQMATGANPVGGVVTSSKPRTDSCWAPQSVYVSTGYSWPVSWLRFEYQDEQVAQEKVIKVKKSFSDLEVGDKVKWIGNDDTRRNGYHGIGEISLARVAAQPYLTFEGDLTFKYADGSDCWWFRADDYGTLYVDYTEPTKAVEPAPYKFKVGDKVRFKSRNLPDLKGRWSPQLAWCGQSISLKWDGLKDDHVFTVTGAPYLGGDGQDVNITSGKTPGTWFSLACDLVLVQDETVSDTSSKAGEPTKVKLTKQQKSAKRLLRLILKAQLESRNLRELSPGMDIGCVNVAGLVCRIHPVRETAKKAAKNLGLSIDDIAGDLKAAW